MRGWRGKELSSLGSIAARSIFVRSICNKLFVGGEFSTVSLIYYIISVQFLSNLNWLVSLELQLYCLVYWYRDSLLPSLSINSTWILSISTFSSYIALILRACKYHASYCCSGLSYDTNEAALKDAFSQHGDIIEGCWYLLRVMLFVCNIVL